MSDEEPDSEATEAISRDTPPEVPDQQDAPPAVTDQDTPPAVLRKMYSATAEDDKDRYLQCFRSPTQDQKFVDAYYGFYVSGLCFKAKLENVFGREGSQRFEDFTTLEAGAIAFCLPPLDKSVRWWESVQFDICGDKATCLDPYRRRAWNMVRRKGVWQIDLSTYPSLNQHAAELRKGKDGVDKCMPEIDKPGMTVDSIRLRVGELTPFP